MTDEEMIENRMGSSMFWDEAPPTSVVIGGKRRTGMAPGIEWAS